MESILFLRTHFGNLSPSTFANWPKINMWFIENESFGQTVALITTFNINIGSLWNMLYYLTPHYKRFNLKLFTGATTWLANSSTVIFFWQLRLQLRLPAYSSWRWFLLVSFSFNFISKTNLSKAWNQKYCCAFWS